MKTNLSVSLTRLKEVITRKWHTTMTYTRPTSLRWCFISSTTEEIWFRWLSWIILIHLRALSLQLATISATMDLPMPFMLQQWRRDLLGTTMWVCKRVITLLSRLGYYSNPKTISWLISLPKTWKLSNEGWSLLFCLRTWLNIQRILSPSSEN